MKQIVFLILALAAILFFWENIVLYPLKLLVVFFHEASHALATILTGGEVSELVVNRRQGGHVISGGGSHFIVLSAGYLGSLALGMGCYLVAVKTRKDKIALFLLGVFIVLIAIMFVPILDNTFGFCFCILTGGSLMALGFKASEKVNDVILQVIGLTSMMYVPLDIYSDTIQRSEMKSDARMLAEEFFGTTMMWGGLWFILSIFLVGFVLWLSMKKEIVAVGSRTERNRV